MHLAAREGHEYTVRCLVDKGANINIKDNAGVRETIYWWYITGSTGFDLALFPGSHERMPYLYWKLANYFLLLEVSQFLLFERDDCQPSNSEVLKESGSEGGRGGGGGFQLKLTTNIGNLDTSILYLYPNTLDNHVVVNSCFSPSDESAARGS